jgi:hypothetical protein
MTSLKIVTKVAINTVYGGFRLSQKAAELLAQRKRAVAVNRGDSGYAYYVLVGEDSLEIDLQELPRNDADLIAVVESLGPDRSGADSGRIEIREVDVFIDINARDGKESVRVHGSAC